MFARVSSLLPATPAAQAAVAYTNLTVSPLAVRNDIDGIYLNVVTGVSGTFAAAVTGWDINL